MFGLTTDDFIPQVEGVITIGEFYEMAAGAHIIFTYSDDEVSSANGPGSVAETRPVAHEACGAEACGRYLRNSTIRG